MCCRLINKQICKRMLKPNVRRCREDWMRWWSAETGACQSAEMLMLCLLKCGEKFGECAALKCAPRLSSPDTCNKSPQRRRILHVHQQELSRA